MNQKQHTRTLHRCSYEQARHGVTADLPSLRAGTALSAADTVVAVVEAVSDPDLSAGDAVGREDMPSRNLLLRIPARRDCDAKHDPS